MKASASINVCRASDGSSRVTTMRSDGPLQLRCNNNTVYLVGGGAAPLGGDRLNLTVSVDAGATLKLRSVAAMLAQPDAHGSPSVFTTTILLDEGATLDWRPLPTISVAGSHHTADTNISLAHSSTLNFSDDIRLGRWNEPSGTLFSSLRIERSGAALLHNTTHLGTGSEDWVWPGISGPIRRMQTTISPIRSLHDDHDHDHDHSETSRFDEPHLGDLSYACVHIEQLAVSVSVARQLSSTEKNIDSVALLGGPGLGGFGPTPIRPLP